MVLVRSFGGLFELFGRDEVACCPHQEAEGAVNSFLEGSRRLRSACSPATLSPPKGREFRLMCCVVVGHVVQWRMTSYHTMVPAAKTLPAAKVLPLAIVVAPTTVVA